MYSKAIFVFSSLSYLYPSLAQAGNTIDTNCPLLGAVYPPPTNLSSCDAISSAKVSFLNALQDAFSLGTLDNTTTSFSIRVFSASETDPLFDQYFEAPGINGSLTSGVLDENTVYRVGSFTKLITAYAILTELGFGQLQDPVTKYIPELAAAAKSSDPLVVSWNDVTLDALLSHLAGIARDYSFLDLANEPDLPIAELGFPQLNIADIPKCGLGNNLTLCTRQAYLEGVIASNPVVASYYTPIYSNVAYALLGYAIENITGLAYEDFVQKALIKPLNMTRTSFSPPENLENSIIPVNISTSYFGADAGQVNPAGGAFSSLNDMTTMGQSILQSRLLSKSITRHWMKPHTHTSDPTMSVGAPWEIARQPVQLSNSTIYTRLVDLYTKAGDIGTYSSQLILDADHNTGFSILAAGLESHQTVVVLGDLLTEVFVPAFEQAAAEEAAQTFGGFYSLGSGNNASNITIAIDQNRPGLGITTWFSNGVDMFDTLKTLGGVTDPSTNYNIRLDFGGVYSNTTTNFRAVFEALPKTLDNNTFGTNCQTWVGEDQPKYGNVALDDFAFEFGPDNKVQAINARALRQRLPKQ